VLSLNSLYILVGVAAIRTGRLLETLDAFAADIAHRYVCGISEILDVGWVTFFHRHVTLGERRPDVTLTTARLGGLNFVEKISIKNDLILRGAVTWYLSSLLCENGIVNLFVGKVQAAWRYKSICCTYTAAVKRILAKRCL